MIVKIGTFRNFLLYHEDVVAGKLFVPFYNDFVQP